MADIATMMAIIANVKTVASGEGIKFSEETYEDVSIPAALLPYGAVKYDGIEYEYTHGQRAGYAEINLILRVVFKERNIEVLTRELLTWTDRLRDSLTVNALNISDLAASKLVSKVSIEDRVDIENKANRSILTFPIFVRYREA